jgi:predicted site-specific integrase-resolvase
MIENKTENILVWPRWLPTKLAKIYSGLSDKTLRQLYKNGDIYAKNIGGGKYYFDKESIDKFMLKEDIELKVGLANIGRINANKT